MAGRLASEWEGGVELKRNNSKSGYYGVIPAGKRWQARLYKPSKKGLQERLGPCRHLRHCATGCRSRGEGEEEARRWPACLLAAI